MLARITPGVVNIAVRGRVREQNPLLQDPFFRRFFNLPQNQQPEERETQATGSGRHRRRGAGLCADQRPCRRERDPHRGHDQGQPPLCRQDWSAATPTPMSRC